MNRAQYTSTLVAGGNNGKYPLSTQTLAFIQSQIELLQMLARIGGARYILKEPENGQIGIVVIDGEVLPLAADPQTGAAIKIVEERVDITADGIVYTEARIMRSAKYVAKYASNDDSLYRVATFGNFATNVELYNKLQELEDYCQDIENRLYVTSGVCSLSTINAQKTNMRLHCQYGSYRLNGADEYIINVYRNGDKCTQEQVLMNMRRYKREYNFKTGEWSEFTPVTQSLDIEVRVSQKKVVEVRHGELPDGAKLILLRKKRRSKKRRSGGANTVNTLFEGVVIRRSPKNAYVHYKEIVLSTGSAGVWYQPKCVSWASGEKTVKVGDTLYDLCRPMFVWASKGKWSGSYRVQYTSKRYSAKARVEGTNADAYAKIGLQLIVGDPRTVRCERGGIIRMKFRGGYHSRTDGVKENRYSFSVE